MGGCSHTFMRDCPMWKTYIIDVSEDLRTEFAVTYIEIAREYNLKEAPSVIESAFKELMFEMYTDFYTNYLECLDEDWLLDWNSENYDQYLYELLSDNDSMLSLFHSLTYNAIHHVKRYGQWIDDFYDTVEESITADDTDEDIAEITRTALCIVIRNLIPKAQDMIRLGRMVIEDIPPNIACLCQGGHCTLSDDASTAILQVEDELFEHNIFELDELEDSMGLC